MSSGHCIGLPYCYDPDNGDLYDAMHGMGGDLIAMIEAYIDESGTDAGSPVLCVAGYLFSKGSRIKLEKKWDKILGREGVDVLHWHECKEPRCLRLRPGESEEERKGRHSRMAEALLSSLNRYTEAGVVVSYDKTFPFEGRVDQVFRSRFGGAQTMATLNCLAGIARWADAYDYHGKISYFLEDGSDEGALIDSVMRSIAQDADLSARFRYHSRAFKPKRFRRALQSADLLAWEIQKLERGLAEYEPLRMRKSMLLLSAKTKILRLDSWAEKMIADCSKFKSWEPDLIRLLIPQGPAIPASGRNGILR